MAEADRAAPFREAPRMLDCPRCGENLERIGSGIEICARCEGVWLAKVTIEKSFGTPYWPAGAGAWWRRELECPACALENRGSQMTPIMAKNLLVDRCGEHGVWLDAGELGRLIDAPRAVELEAFYELVKPGGQLPTKLREFREQRDARREQHLRELEAFRAKAAAEEAARRAEIERVREQERLRLEAEELEKRAAERAARRASLTKERELAEQVVATRQKELLLLREKQTEAEAVMREVQHRISESQARVREGETKLGIARDKLIEVERLLGEL